MPTARSLPPPSVVPQCRRAVHAWSLRIHRWYRLHKQRQHRNSTTRSPSSGHTHLLDRALSTATPLPFRLEQVDDQADDVLRHAGDEMLAARAAESLVIIVLAFLVAAVVPNVSVVLGFLGSTLASCVCYIMPAAFYLKSLDLPHHMQQAAYSVVTPDLNAPKLDEGHASANASRRSASAPRARSSLTSASDTNDFSARPSRELAGVRSSPTGSPPPEAARGHGRTAPSRAYSIYRRAVAWFVLLYGIVLVLVGTSINVLELL